MAPGIRATLWIFKINYLPLILILIFIYPIPTIFKRLPNKSIYMLGKTGVMHPAVSHGVISHVGRDLGLHNSPSAGHSNYLVIVVT